MINKYVKVAAVVVTALIIGSITGFAATKVFNASHNDNATAEILSTVDKTQAPITVTKKRESVGNTISSKKVQNPEPSASDSVSAEKIENDGESKELETAYDQENFRLVLNEILELTEVDIDRTTNAP